MSHRRRHENRPTEVTDPSQDMKRRRLIGKQPPETEVNDCPWLGIVKRINVIVPRVGRIDVGDPQIIADLQHLIRDRQIIRVIACRGTDRTLAPPQDLERGEAPYRKSLVVLRDTGELRLETMWESWEELPKHMIVRRNHACRLNITMFSPQCSVPQADQREVNTSNPNPPDPTTTPESFTSLQGPVSEDRVTAEVQDPHQDSAVRILSVSERQWIGKLHKNLGHPSGDKLAHVLKQQGYDARLVEAARVYRCSTCDESKAPTAARPARLHEPLDFNDCISIDEPVYTSQAGERYHIYHILDHGTSFHYAFTTPRPCTSEVIHGLMQGWLSWAGAPGKLLVDAASELGSEEFLSFLQSQSITCTTIAPRAHWQNGKSERHGAILEHMIRKYDMEKPIRGYHDLRAAL